MPDETGLLAERDAIESLARLVHGAIPEGFSTGILRVSSLAPTSLLSLEVRDEAGRKDSVRTRGPFAAQAEALRALMYRPEVGTWFSFEMTVTTSGSVTTRFNFDDEPEWDVPVDPVAYLVDQEKFPRDEAHQPDWLRARLAEGRERRAAASS